MKTTSWYMFDIPRDILEHIEANNAVLSFESIWGGDKSVRVIITYSGGTRRTEYSKSNTGAIINVLTRMGFDGHGYEDDWIDFGDDLYLDEDDC